MENDLVNISDKKAELLGLSIARRFRLKKNRKGLYLTKDGAFSAKGLGNSIILTLLDTIKHTEEELQKFVDENAADDQKDKK